MGAIRESADLNQTEIADGTYFDKFILARWKLQKIISLISGRTSSFLKIWICCWMVVKRSDISWCNHKISLQFNDHVARAPLQTSLGRIGGGTSHQADCVTQRHNSMSNTQNHRIKCCLTTNGGLQWVALVTSLFRLIQLNLLCDWT